MPEIQGCKIVPKKIETHQLRLFEEEIEEAEFVAMTYNLSYEQLFVKLVKEEEKRILKDLKK